MSTSTNKTSISYVKEVTAGSTPATPVFQLLPTLSGGPKGNISTAQSESINSTRSVDDLIVVDSEVDGSINFELSHAPYKPILESLMQSTISVDSFGTADISTTQTSGTNGTIDSAGLEDFTAGNLVVDQHIKVEGFLTDTAANGIYRVKTINATQLVVEKIDGNMINAAAGDTITISGRVIRNGTSTPDSYTFLKKVEGINNTAFMYYPGCQVSSLNLNFETGAILKGDFGIVGLSENVTETEIVGSTYNAVPSYSLMNSVTSIAGLIVEGLPATTEFSNFNLKYDNNINRAKAIGTLGSIGLSSFTLSAMADITMYFEDIISYNYYKNSTSFSVTLLTKDASGNHLVFRLPKCKFESLESPISGKDNFFMLNGSLKALQDATNNYTMQIDVL